MMRMRTPASLKLIRVVTLHLCLVRMDVLLTTPVANAFLANPIRIAMCHLCLVHTGVLLPTPAENVLLVNLTPAKGIIVQAAYNAAKPDVLHMALLTALVVVALYV